MLKAITGQRGKILWGLAIISMVLTFVAMSVSGAVLYQRFTQGSQYREQNAAAWHLVLCAAERETEKSPDLTPQRKAHAIMFYDRILVQLGSRPCKEKK